MAFIKLEIFKYYKLQIVFEIIFMFKTINWYSIVGIQRAPEGI